MLIIRDDHIILVAVLGAHALFLLPTNASASLGQRERYCQLPHYITRRNYVNHLGTWNVRGINDTVKEKMMNIFKKGKFKLLAACLDGEEIERERYHG